MNINKVESKENAPEQVFLGSLFGDGSLSKMGGKYLYYCETHSLKQKDYLLWKMRLMSKNLNFANSPYYFNMYDKRTGKYYFYVKINSSDSGKLKEYYEGFYKNNKKIIPKDFLFRLDKFGLAIWYQDDGNYQYGRKSSFIATYRFTYKEHLLIQKFLKERYSINSNIFYKEDGYYIQFDMENTEKFLQTIQDYIHKSMVYKLGHLDSSNDDRIRKAKEVISKNKKEYRRKHKEEIIAYQKEYRKKNIKKIALYNKIYWIKNKEKIRKNKKGWYKLNRNQILKRRKLVKLKNGR